MYWAKELANQSADAGLQATFASVADALANNETKIVEELNAVQGAAMDIDGYYFPDAFMASDAMRPSATLNAIIDAI